MSGGDRRRVEQHDPEVLGDVARDPRSPSRGCSRGSCRSRPPARTGTGSRDGRRGRSRRGCRAASAATGMAAPRPAEKPRRSQLPPPPDEQEERRGEEHRETGRAGEAEEEAGEELAAVDASPDECRQRRQRVPARLGAWPCGRAHLASAPGSGRSSTSIAASRIGAAARRPPPGGRGRRRGRGPGTTSSRAGPRTRAPSRRRRRAWSRGGRQRRIGSRPSIHQARPTSMAPTIREDQLAIRVAAPSATNGSSRTAGSGGNGMSPRGTPSDDATWRTSLKKALPG